MKMSSYFAHFFLQIIINSTNEFERKNLNFKSFMQILDNKERPPPTKKVFPIFKHALLESICKFISIFR